MMLVCLLAQISIKTMMNSQEKMITCPHYWAMPNVSGDTWHAKVIVLGNPFFVIIYIDISLPEPMGQGAELLSHLIFFQ